MKFQTNYALEKAVGEWFEPDTSETEEGQAQSVKAVYERCLRGEMVPQGKDFYYEEEVGIMEHPDSDLADITTISDYRHEQALKQKAEASGKLEAEQSESKSNARATGEAVDDANASVTKSPS